MIATSAIRWCSAAASADPPQQNQQSCQGGRCDCGHRRSHRSRWNHGATFSSAELTDTHADEFSHAVQIGNGDYREEGGDVILQARDRKSVHRDHRLRCRRIEQRDRRKWRETGAIVDLDKVPLKYAGLRYDEIWISEAQERMVVSVPGDRVEALLNWPRGKMWKPPSSAHSARRNAN